MNNDPYPLVINGINIHSRYNPQKEADKFIRIHISESSIPNQIFLLGPGRGYLIESIKLQYPQIQVCALFFDKKNYDFISNHNPEILENVLFWFPESPMSIEEFILNLVSEVDFTSVKFIEWPPSSKAYPKLNSIISNKIASVSKKINSNIITTGGFGRKWIRNAFRNFLYTDNVYSFRNFTGPLLIAASGPSLELQKKQLKKNRSYYILGSLPSTALFFRSNNISPDFYVTTDPGFYARWHYQYFDKNIPIIRSLSSSFSESILKNRNIFCTQNNFAENLIMQLADITLPVLPTHGTVAGSIGAFAQNRTQSFLAYAGLDLCFNDIKSHVCPHSFDSHLLVSSQRLTPLPSLYFKRAFQQAPVKSGRLRTGPVLKTYAENFMSPNSKNTFRLCSTDIFCQGLQQCNWEIFNKAKSTLSFETYSLKWPSLSSRKEILTNLLKNWRSNLLGYLENNGKDVFKKLYLDRETLTLLYQLETADVLKIKRNRFLKDETILNMETYAMLEKAYEYLNRFEYF